MATVKIKISEKVTKVVDITVERTELIQLLAGFLKKEIPLSATISTQCSDCCSGEPDGSLSISWTEVRIHEEEE